MQATVREFNTADCSGSVFLDDGTVCGFGPDVFAASGLRLLRRGQRVAARKDRDDRAGQLGGREVGRAARAARTELADRAAHADGVADLYGRSDAREDEDRLGGAVVAVRSRVLQVEAVRA